MLRLRRGVEDGGAEDAAEFSHCWKTLWIQLEVSRLELVLWPLLRKQEVQPFFNASHAPQQTGFYSVPIASLCSQLSALSRGWPQSGE